MKTKKNLKILRWTARIVSLPLIVFIGIQIFFPENGYKEFFTGKDGLLPLFYPIAYFIGLIVSWKWDLIGGIISVIGLIVTLFFRIDLIFMVIVLSFPADLFILYWYLAREEKETV